jgi:hypothetical protein
MAAMTAAERDTTAMAGALLRFACQAAAALAEREPDPIEDVERAAVFGSEDAAPAVPGEAGGCQRRRSISQAISENPSGGGSHGRVR